MTDRELDARFEAFGAKLKADISADIKAEIRAEGIITRRRFDVVAKDSKQRSRSSPTDTPDVTGLKAGQERQGKPSKNSYTSNAN